MIRLPSCPEQFRDEHISGEDFTGDECGFDLDEFAVDYSPDPEPELDLHEECRNFFVPDGTLSSLNAINGRPTEERPHQLAMATAIAHPAACAP